MKRTADGKPISLADCPQKSKHTKCPTGYIAWHDWAERKSKKHRQVKCPGCGLYAIWKRKKRKGGDADGR